MIFDLVLLCSYIGMSRIRDIRYVAICSCVAQLTFMFFMDVVRIEGAALIYCMPAGIALVTGRLIYNTDNLLGSSWFLLIFICLLGYVDYKANSGPVVYDTLCVILSIIQLIIMTYRAKREYIDRKFRIAGRVFVFCWSNRVGDRQGDIIDKKEESQ